MDTPHAPRPAAWPAGLPVPDAWLRVLPDGRLDMHGCSIVGADGTLPAIEVLDGHPALRLQAGQYIRGGFDHGATPD